MHRMILFRIWTLSADFVSNIFISEVEEKILLAYKMDAKLFMHVYKMKVNAARPNLIDKKYLIDKGHSLSHVSNIMNNSDYT